MATQLRGPVSWSGGRDEQGYRTYKLRSRIRADTTDGPANVLRTPGLLLPGAPWSVSSDLDTWVWVRPDATAQLDQHQEGDPHRWWIVEQTASNKPLSANERQYDEPDDPLLKPQKVSGTYTKYTEETSYDRFGNLILTSSHEDVTGPEVEFDANRPTVEVEQNVATLGLNVFGPLIDVVNSLPLWGLPKRCVKLSNVAWEKQFYGTSSVYYTRRFSFDINVRTFDRNLRDRGSKVLRGYWGKGGAEGVAWILKPLADGTQPDPKNPTHFERYKDRANENTVAILDGAGKPAVTRGLPVESIGGFVDVDPVHTMLVTTVGNHGLAVNDKFEIVGASPPYLNATYTVKTVNSPTAVTVDQPVNNSQWLGGGTVYIASKGPGVIHVEKYPQADLLILGIPATL